MFTKHSVGNKTTYCRLNSSRKGGGGAYSWGIIIRCMICFVDGTFTGGGALQWQCMVVEILWNKFK